MHPEIELNLVFKDYLRNNPVARDNYGKLKAELLTHQSSFEKNNSSFTGYNLGKEAFIRNALQQAGFNRIRFMKCTHYAELDAAKRFREKYFSHTKHVIDPYVCTFDHPDHAHLVLYQGTEIIGYAHIQFWPNHRAEILINSVDEDKSNQNAGSEFLSLIEKWLKMQGYKTIHAESTPAALEFYRKNGYGNMQFNDPDDYKSVRKNIVMKKSYD